MLCKCFIRLCYILCIFTAFCLGGPFFSGHGVYTTQTQRKTQQNKTTLVQSPLTTLGQETRWAYSTKVLRLSEPSRGSYPKPLQWPVQAVHDIVLIKMTQYIEQFFLEYTHRLNDKLIR